MAKRNALLQLSFSRVFRVSLAAGFVVLSGSVLVAGADSKAAQIDPTQLKTEVSRCEHLLKNLDVNFSVTKESWDIRKGSWQFVSKSHGEAWYAGMPRNEVRIRFDDQISRWVHGASPLIEQQFTIAFDGTMGLNLTNAVGSPGNLKQILYGTITPIRSPMLAEYSDQTTGWGYSLYGIFDRFGNHLSDSIGAAGAKAKEPPKYVWSNVGSTPCLEFILYNSTGGRDVFDLDPARSYALLRHVHYQNAELAVQRLQVSSLIEAAPGVFFPRQATMELDNNPAGKLGTRFGRTTYTATRAIANDPHFPANAFDIAWPVGTNVQDTITGVAYTVTAPSNRQR